MSRILGWGITLLSTTLLVSCASINPPVEPARLAAIQNGKTTRAEVEATLGKPQMISTLMDGVYVVYVVRLKPQNPDAEIESRYVSFRYDSAGVVQDLDRSGRKSLITVTPGSGPAPSTDEARAGGTTEVEETKPKRKPFVWPKNDTPNR